MIQIRDILSRNLLLKITSLNALVLTIKLSISIFVQRILALMIGEVGIASIGQMRNLIEIISSTSTLGIFNGIVKYVAEYKEDSKVLSQLFSTASLLLFIGSIISGIVLFFYASCINVLLFRNLDLVWIIKLLAFLPFIIGANRVFYGIINGLSEYKKYAKVDLISYVLSVLLLLLCLYYNNLEGAIFAVVVTPIIELLIIGFVLGGVIKKQLKIPKLNLKFPFAKELFAFTLMSFASTVLINYIEIDIRTMIANRIDVNEAGYWTAITFVSKNYMAFSSAIFTLYVIPKFARIHTGSDFLKEIINIYKTILPLFGMGMLVVYFLRETIIFVVYPNFLGMEPLFKWQLMGDFVRLGSLVIAHQFLAKKMVISFIITELSSLALFYCLAKYFVGIFGATGVVMAHFYRYIVYFLIVAIVIFKYFYNRNKIS